MFFFLIFELCVYLCIIGREQHQYFVRTHSGLCVPRNQSWRPILPWLCEIGQPDGSDVQMKLPWPHCEKKPRLTRRLFTAVNFSNETAGGLVKRNFTREDIKLITLNFWNRITMATEHVSQDLFECLL